MAKERVRKHLNYLFLNTGTTDLPEWKRAETSTDFAVAMNAETETFDYIADENPTDELKSYKPTLAQTQTALIGDPVYDYVFGLYFKNSVGQEAVGQYMIVYQQKGTTAGSNMATQGECLITVDTYDLVAQTITYTIGFRGTPSRGEASVDPQTNEPTFTPKA